ncbi:hypothetical protein COV05_01330 [Candidatus Uhrbacteria bacterium CG10_big_fil_rev_8_21_14_0_10_48_16]|uniref:Uncharacterized protein n=1 Tax=Candidatus Uhrbacteria bacterium CG10_big_fil_rev_8_21_14_0_10_48_16 TaxID=1975038 RepID=A0A2M8LHY4_9BACT|nr:MAG: hypothetical protein COV05_01330 [Candidatus Uhrbacteria bacterium CG10_big_fil_rev_8_21_14_0_10_48_16]
MTDLTLEKNGLKLRKALDWLKICRRTLRDAQQKLDQLHASHADAETVQAQREKIQKAESNLETAFKKYLPMVSKNGRERMSTFIDPFEALQSELATALAQNGMRIRHQRKKRERSE